MRRRAARPWVVYLAIVPFALTGWPGETTGQSLRGGQASMDAQNRMARVYDYTFLRNAAEVRRFFRLGRLVELKGNRHYRLDDEVSFPYARPEVKTFVERLGRQYRAACGEQLVVTSLTRPLNRQPGNASAESVHPTGMAVDLRWSLRRECRSWLEDVLLHLERVGTVEATRERSPPHYHVAVYTRAYSRYVAALQAAERAAGETMAELEAQEEQAGGSSDGVVRYRVRSGDTLWGIARAYGTTVDAIKSANDLRGNRIDVGQLLRIPVGSHHSLLRENPE